MHRSRLAIAVAITLAAVPILVIDNLPATADANEQRVVAVGASRAEALPSAPATTAAPASTSTTEAPTAVAAPPTEAPATTAQDIEAPVPEAPAPPTTAAPPPPAPTPAASPGDPNDPASWDGLAACEAGGNWAMNSGNGYYGGLQFSLGTWQDLGGVGYPHLASKAEQILRGKILQARGGWAQWPHCAGELGYL